MSDRKTTEAIFVPEDRKGLHRPNSIEWMVMVAGVGICGIGGWWVAVGLAIFLVSFYYGFFVNPQVARGLYFGQCPYCNAKMSATHYQEELGCPSCQQIVRVRDSRFEVK